MFPHESEVTMMRAKLVEAYLVKEYYDDFMVAYSLVEFIQISEGVFGDTQVLKSFGTRSYNRAFFFFAS